MLHKFADTLSYFLCSGTSELTKRQKSHMKKYFYCNNADTFLDISNKLRGKLVEFQKLQPCEVIKEALAYRVMTVLGRN